MEISSFFIVTHYASKAFFSLRKKSCYERYHSLRKSKVQNEHAMTFVLSLQQLRNVILVKPIKSNQKILTQNTYSDHGIS